MDRLTKLLISSLIILAWVIIVVISIGSFLRFTGVLPTQ